MIGLGSNKMSVCRRGGMSVTQAGRGGMEWLAGGRVPSWANPYLPYSRAAGEALVAQFPTQWPTIRDYGFAHPALVPFINEDPMLVMSLIEGLGTRWLVGDGASWVVIDGFNINVNVWTKQLRYKLGNIAGCPAGARNIDNSMNGFNTLFTNGRYDSKGYTTGYQASGTIGIVEGEDYTLTDISATKVRQYRNRLGTYVDYTKSLNQSQNSKLSPYLCLFGVNSRDANNVDAVSQVGNMQIAVAEFADAPINGNSLIKLVPFHSATRQGVVDALTGRFYPNQGTGAFTTIEQIAS